MHDLQKYAYYTKEGKMRTRTRNDNMKARVNTKKVSVV